MITSIKVLSRRIRSFFSRSEWAIRLLGLSRLNRSSDQPGLVMVQIDGLSLTQFQRAIEDGHLPFLKSLLNKERYVRYPFCSGLPSNTPAVQGELFYGIKTCVPAFNFVDRTSGKPVKMFDTAYVAALEEHLKTQGHGLLAGGSAYSNIFTGGASEAHCCWAKIGWRGVWHAINPLIFPFLFIFYIDIFVRTFFLLIVEVIIAVFECIRGTLKGRVFLKELESVYLRVLVCVSLREFITVGASMDIMRGLPVIHLNFLGYDEQAHARGPSSKFAHWSLKGIDDAIKRIDRVIKRSPHRDYDLWVYSDHGQEKTEPYLIRHGCTLEEGVKKVFKGLEVVVTAMGPMGHIYAQQKLNKHDMDSLAQGLVREAHIPLVITRRGDNKISAWTQRGQFILPDESDEVFGGDHPFLSEVTKDILRACHHPDAGDFIILGWCQGEVPISFALEYGAHAGATIEETRAFALLPSDVYIEPDGNDYLRPIDLRKAVQNFLSQKHFIRTVKPSESRLPSKTLRVMSYNVHGCRGMDGRVSTDRIARVIARYDPDVVALQELDAGRLRSAGVDQAEMIAKRLGMSFYFHSARRHKEEQYGNAILSRYPIALVKKDSLPKLWDRTFLEPRGAIWVMVDHHGTKINLVNTHLSLWSEERLLQMQTLLSGDWLRHPDCSGPIILCGDLNMSPKSRVYKEICKRLNDSQLMLAGHKPAKTWFAGYPFRRIDHIFVTPEIRVHSVHVSHTALDRSASDHLPIITDVSLELENSVLINRGE